MFVLRSGDDEPWAPVSFGQLADGTPYLYMSGPGGPPRRLSHRRCSHEGSAPAMRNPHPFCPAMPGPYVVDWGYAVDRGYWDAPDQPRSPDQPR